jgi:hypothetical protein
MRDQRTPVNCASKALLHSWTPSLRFQLRGTSVGVLELIPTYVQTDIGGPQQANDLVKISIYQRSTGRWIVTWYDEHGVRRSATYATRKEAGAIQKQKRAELERHRETRFDVDDRQMYSLARDIASRHGIHGPAGCARSQSFPQISSCSRATVRTTVAASGTIQAAR